MDKQACIANTLAEILKAKTGKELFFTARVVSVSGATCTIDYDGLELSGVRLLATTTGGADKVLIIPKAGSWALIGCEGDLANLWIVRGDEAQQIEITVGGQNVMSLISDLISTLSGTLTLTTTVGAATGNFAPDTIAKLSQIEKAFKQVFK